VEEHQQEIKVNRVKCLKDFGDSIVKDQRDRMQNFEKNDKGNMSKSFEYRIIDTPNGPSIEFMVIDYGKYVDKGRAPFIGYPAMRLVVNPMELKRRKLAKEGTKPFMILRDGGDVFSQTRMNKLVEDYEVAAGKDIEAQWDQIADEFNNSK
jgi:hypothetical protein